MLNVEEAFEEFYFILRDFADRNNYKYQIVQSGRSDGYLVLIYGGRRNDGTIFTQGVVLTSVPAVYFPKDKASSPYLPPLLWIAFTLSPGY